MYYQGYQMIKDFIFSVIVGNKSHPSDCWWLTIVVGE